MAPAEILLLVILSVVSLLLIHGRVRPDLTAMITLAVLGLSGLVTPAEAFSGFASSAVMTILAISVVSEGLHQSGVTKFLSRQMSRLGRGNEPRLVFIAVISSALLSLFMNNIAAAGVLMPAVIALSRRTRIPPSKLLMPMAFGTILGGMATLLTTSNIIVSDALRLAGHRPFGLLDFLPIGVLVVGGGALYLTGPGRRFLPVRYPAGQEARTERLRAELTGLYGLRQNLVELMVLEGSCLSGINIKEGDWARRFGVNILGISRGGQIRFGPRVEEVVREGDVLLVQGEVVPSEMESCGLKILPGVKESQEVADENTVLGEVVLSPRATMAGKTLKEIHFRDKYRLNVLAIWRESKPLREGLADIPLRFGDALLVQGRPLRIRLLRDDRDFILLEEDPDSVLQPRKAGRAAAILLMVLGIAAFGWLPVAEISLVGAILMILAGCLTMDDAYRSIEWKAIFLIAGMWPLGIAIRSSGLADTIAPLIGGASQYGSTVLALALIMVGLVLTQLLGSQVASIVLTPVGLTIAASVGAEPRAIGMAIALSCSLAFLTPLGHPVNMLVMGSGGYSFRDYLKVGGPLTLLTLLIIILGLKVFWGL
ncbi:MAG: SLC13 family permease [Anaerolineales bacterium]|nr:SLC13 family permease [Anaerolineales bacterium]